MNWTGGKRARLKRSAGSGKASGNVNSEDASLDVLHLQSNLTALQQQVQAIVRGKRQRRPVPMAGKVDSQRETVRSEFGVDGATSVVPLASDSPSRLALAPGSPGNFDSKERETLAEDVQVPWWSPSPSLQKEPAAPEDQNASPVSVTTFLQTLSAKVAKLEHSLETLERRIFTVEKRNNHIANPARRNSI